MSEDPKRPLHLGHACPACRSRAGEDCWVGMSQAGEPQGVITTVDGVWTHLERVQLADLTALRARHEGVPMREHLQPWYDRWLAHYRATDLLYVGRDRRGEVMLPQVHFVRERLAGLLWADVPYDERPTSPPRSDCKETAYVIGEHTSKSVRLPVYSLERPDLGLQFVLRENYHDWNVSVVSETPITTDLRGFELDYARKEDRDRYPDGYRAGGSWGYCYFQGFPRELQFGPHSEDPRRFSLCIDSAYEVYTLLWLILRDRHDRREGSAGAA